ncbi:hypothetical protein P3L51_12045 [Streptomyces sp. PSRA5]|uniref:hypothetical protein n=1 Tax=Streptomyces panacea TaxID=3035064 RepID=UPI00339CB106
MKKSQRAQMFAVAALSVLALAVAGCSQGGEGGSSANDASAGQSAGGNEQDQQLKVEECLQKHGVTINDAESGKGPSGIDYNDMSETEINEVNKTCGADQMSRPDEHTQVDQKTKDKILDYAQCMRDQGLDFPDPTFENGGAMMPMNPSDNPEIVDQDAKCQSKLEG